MVINMRSAAGMAAIWLTAVAGVSATAWYAIDRAGRDITGASGSSLPLPPLTTPTRASQPIPTGVTPLPPTTAAPSAKPEPSATATPLPSRSATSTPSPSSTPPPSATPRPPAPAPAPAPVTRYRTVNVTGGLVTVRCTGAAIRLQNAQPENEWRVHVDTSTSGRIEVSFRKGEDEEGLRTQVTAVCTNGTPTFKVSNG